MRLRIGEILISRNFSDVFLKHNFGCGAAASSEKVETLIYYADPTTGSAVYKHTARANLLTKERIVFMPFGVIYILTRLRNILYFLVEPTQRNFAATVSLIFASLANE